MVWNRSRRRNPPRASWSLSPAQGCHTQRLSVGSPGVNSHRLGRGWGAGQVGSGRGSRGGAWAGPAGLGAPFPSALPVAARVTWSASPWPLWAPPQQRPDVARDPCPWRGRARVPGGGFRGSGLCMRACVCACSLQHWQAACDVSWCRGWGGVKGASEPTDLGQDPSGAGRGRAVHTPSRTYPLHGHTQRQRHTSRCSTFTHVHTL